MEWLICVKNNGKAFGSQFVFVKEDHDGELMEIFVRYLGS